jgi:hypothetical protein
LFEEWRERGRGRGRGRGKERVEEEDDGDDDDDLTPEKQEGECDGGKDRMRRVREWIDFSVAWGGVDTGKGSGVRK